jgi:hypothetical protein
MTLDFLVKRLRSMVQRQGKRDRETIVMAVQALTQLANRCRDLELQQGGRLQQVKEPNPTLQETMRAMAGDPVDLQHRVDQGELLSDRENDVLHSAYHGWMRQERKQNHENSWDAFVVALRALYKQSQVSPQQTGVLTDIQE